MGKKVFANGMEIVHKAGSAKVIAAFPDVCMSPPPPPAGPVPVPYPNTSGAADLQDGTKTVQIGDKPAGVQDSFYKTSPLGDEAATRNFGGSVVTHGITGKTYFKAHSMNVTFEGKPVVRHLDLTGCNASSEPAVPIGPSMESAAGSGDAKEGDESKCPCCNKPRHENQKDSSGTPLKPISQEQYYEDKKNVIEAKSAGSDKWAAANPDRLDKKMTLKYAHKVFGYFEGMPAEVAQEEARRGKELLDRLTKTMATNPDCPNVPKTPGEGCGTFFGGVPPGKATDARDEFDDRVRDSINKRAAEALKKAVPRKTKVNHVTPLDAGGCPIGEGNLVSDAELTGPCKDIDDLQTELQGRR